jgi:hypothetical protein
LWVIAEPAEQARVTIPKTQATATARAIQAAASTATAIALLPTATPVPTPYAGEPSPAGGLGNTRNALVRALGPATGETSGKLVAFRPPGREVHVAFTPDPPRAALVAVFVNTPLVFDMAVSESRKLFPADARPRAAAPEGNPSFIVERFTSPTLEQALGTGDFSVLYTRDPNDPKGLITGIVFGLADDFTALLDQARR